LTSLGDRKPVTNGQVHLLGDIVLNADGLIDRKVDEREASMDQSKDS